MSLRNATTTVLLLFLAGPVMADPPEIVRVTPEQGDSGGFGACT